RFAAVDLVAPFAGHWHADRVVRTATTLHHVTPNVGFGGIDASPRGYRVVDVSGRDVRSRFVPLEPTASRSAYPEHPHRAPGAPRTGPQWEAGIGGRPGIGPPLVLDGVVAMTTTDDDGSRGG